MGSVHVSGCGRKCQGPRDGRRRPSSYRHSHVLLCSVFFCQNCWNLKVSACCLLPEIFTRSKWLPSPPPSHLSAAVSWHYSKFYFSVSLPSHLLKPTLCLTQFLLLDILNLHSKNHFSQVTCEKPETTDTCDNSLSVTFPLGCVGRSWVLPRPGLQGLGWGWGGPQLWRAGGVSEELGPELEWENQGKSQVSSSGK